MPRKRLTSIAASLLLISILIVLPAKAIATPSSKRSDLARLKNQADSIDRQISIVDEEYLEASLKLKKIDTKVENNSILLLRSQRELAHSKKVLSRRIRQIYKQDESSALDFILATKTFDEFLTNWKYINKISDTDKRLVIKINKAKREAQQAQKRLKSNLKYQASVVKTISQKKQKIQSELQRKKRLIGSVQADLRAYEQAQERQQQRSPSYQNIPSNPSTPIVPPTNAPRSQVVAIARRYLGRPYRWGAAGPNSFDCSGLTMYVYAQVGIGLPHSSRAQFGVGQAVPMNALKPGDLVFRGSPIHHVGIYIGGGSMISAPRTGDVVKVSSAFSGRYAGARRP